MKGVAIGLGFVPQSSDPKDSYQPATMAFDDLVMELRLPVDMCVAQDSPTPIWVLFDVDASLHATALEAIHKVNT